MGKQKKGSSNKPDKKLWMRIIVLAMVLVMFLGIIILPLLR